MNNKVIFNLVFFYVILFEALVSLSMAVPDLSSQEGTVKNFCLLDHQGHSQELYYYSDMKGVVLFWQGNGCPIVRKTVRNLSDLKAQYEGQGIVFLMVNANPQDDRASIEKEAQEYGIDMPIMEDRAQVVTEMLKVERTAEVILIRTGDWRVMYRGAVDDRLGYEVQKKETGRHFLEDGIKALLEGKEVEIKQTGVKGCLINIETAYWKEPVTYMKDVALVLANKCLRCHSPGNIGPWSMDNYEKVKGWGPMIAEVIRTRRMPPWGVDPHYGKFKNDFSLTADEVRKIMHWVKTGLMKGEGVDPLVTAPKPDHNQWTLGEPDIIITLKEKQPIPATGRLPYRYVESVQVLDRNIWIRGVALKSSNPKVVHHIQVLAAPADVGRDNDHPFQLADVKDYIALYTPGLRPEFYPENSGRFFKKGSKFIFEIHYVTTGHKEVEETQMGLYLLEEEPKVKLHLDFITNYKFRITPHEKNYQVRASKLFKDPITIYRLAPHMHYRGKSMRFTARYPDGNREILLSNPEYNFLWQNSYIYKTPKSLPAGTEIIVDGVFDNSVQNPFNPDPSKEVRYGPQSDDEMFVGGVLYQVDATSE